MLQTSVKKGAKFTKAAFQLLNKNLKLIPTPKVYKKHKLIEELEPFYILLKIH